MNYLLNIDQIINTTVPHLRTNWLTKFFFLFTNFGSTKIVVALVLLTSLYLFIRKHQYDLLTLWITVVGSEGTTWMLKKITDRPRPLDALYLEDSASFPSGHATAAVAFYGFICYLLVKNMTKTWQKYLTITLTAIFALALGFSRLYLGVHYLSDVVAGYLIGGIGLWVVINYKRKT